MNKHIIFQVAAIALLTVNCSSGQTGAGTAKQQSEGYISQLTEAGFKKEVFDYDAVRDWKFEGDKPVVIDFYADWCPPCKQLSPLVDEAAKEYSGKIKFYKVNSDKEGRLLQKLGLSGLPTLLYIPVNGKPQITVGFIPKEKLEKEIKEILLSNKQ